VTPALRCLDPEDGGDIFLPNVVLTFNGLHGVTSQKTELVGSFTDYYYYYYVRHALNGFEAFAGVTIKRRHGVGQHKFTDVSEERTLYIFRSEE
jgi:predicted exporter